MDRASLSRSCFNRRIVGQAAFDKALPTDFLLSAAQENGKVGSCK